MLAGGPRGHHAVSSSWDIGVGSRRSSAWSPQSYVEDAATCLSWPSAIGQGGSSFQNLFGNTLETGFKGSSRVTLGALSPFRLMFPPVARP